MTNKNRRILLKVLGGPAALIPAAWIAPVVVSVALPVHAKTSAGCDVAEIDVVITEIDADPSVVDQGADILIDVVYDVNSSCSCLDVIVEIYSFIPETAFLTRLSREVGALDPGQYKTGFTLPVTNYPLGGGPWPATLYRIKGILGCDGEEVTSEQVVFRVVAP